MAERLEELSRELFMVRRSIRYHQRRLAFFERLHTIFAAIQIIAAAAAFALALADHAMAAAWFAAIVGVLATLDLVVGLARNARVHSDFSRRFAQLERDMSPFETDAAVALAKVTDLRQRRLTIEEDEPPQYRVITLECHNELVRASCPSGVIYPIRLHERWLGSLMHLDVSELMKHGVAWTAGELPRAHSDETALAAPRDYWTPGVIGRMDAERSNGGRLAAGRVVREEVAGSVSMPSWLTLPVVGVGVSVAALVTAITVAFVV